MVKIEIEGKQYEVTEKVFRQIVKGALTQLKTLQQCVPSSEFTITERSALMQVQNWVYDHQKILL